jgi:hypothetical protein
MNPVGAVLFTCLLAGCSRVDRCANCGMKIDPASPWRAEVGMRGGSSQHFDAPRCAFAARLGRRAEGGLTVRDFYDRRERGEIELSFVVGSDVTGPMGADLVPVDRARVSKFLADHGGHALDAQEIEDSVIAHLR